MRAPRIPNSKRPTTDEIPIIPNRTAAEPSTDSDETKSAMNTNAMKRDPDSRNDEPYRIQKSLRPRTVLLRGSGATPEVGGR